MKRDDLLENVQQVGWLADLPESLREALLSSAMLRDRAVGEALYLQGEPPGSLFGLASGSLGVTASLGAFAPRLVHVARPGWWVGEASLVSRTLTRVEIIARAPSTVFVVTTTAIAELARTTPEIWRYLGLLTISHMDDALQLAGCALAPDVRDRVIATLQRLVRPAVPDGGPVDLRITQGELAEMAGLSRNPVGPVLRQLEEAGEIICSRRCIRVSHPEHVSGLIGG